MDTSGLRFVMDENGLRSGENLQPAGEHCDMSQAQKHYKV